MEILFVLRNNFERRKVKSEDCGGTCRPATVTAKSNPKNNIQIRRHDHFFQSRPGPLVHNPTVIISPRDTTV